MDYGLQEARRPRLIPTRRALPSPAPLPPLTRPGVGHDKTRRLPRSRRSLASEERDPTRSGPVRPLTGRLGGGAFTGSEEYDKGVNPFLPGKTLKGSTPTSSTPLPTPSEPRGEARRTILPSMSRGLRSFGEAPILVP